MSDTIRVPSSSVEYVHALVSWRRGVSVDTVITYTVDMAFVADDASDPEPGVSDWVSATWEQIGNRAYAKALVGTGGKVLAEDTYMVWVRVTAGSEIVVRRAAGKLIVT